MNTTTTIRSELKVLPFILTVALVAMGAAVSGFYSLSMLGLFLGATPVALFLLWMTRDVPAPEDRIADVDRERARRSEVATPAPVRMAA